MEKQILNKKDGVIEIEKINNRNKIKVILKDVNVFSPALEFETSYSIDLIDKIADIKGSPWVCNEIMRDESPDYISNVLKHDILSYVTTDDLKGKRILDFGCGCGASSVILARIFPESYITGIEYVKEFVEVCEMRKDFLHIKNLEFQISPSSEVLPNDIGNFDSLNTLAHEFGHAFHSELTKDAQPMHYQSYSTAVAESASTFFENFAFKEVVSKLSEKEKIIALHDKIQGKCFLISLMTFIAD